jgi:hypothetical protein
MWELNFLHTTHYLKAAHIYMHLPGVVYLMKRSELGLAAWCLGSWWCVLWIRNKLLLSNMSSSTRYIQRIYWLWQVLAVRRAQVQERERECRRCISPADSGSAE